MIVLAIRSLKKVLEYYHAQLLCVNCRSVVRLALGARGFVVNILQEGIVIQLLNSIIGSLRDFYNNTASNVSFERGGKGLW